VLHRALADVSVADVVAGLRSVPRSALAAAVALTVVSYLVQTLYDLIALRYVGSTLGWPRIAPHAFCAMAVGHSVGASALSGGAIRYRAYTAAGLSVAQVARILAFYPLTYALGAATLLGVTLMLEPAAAPGGERFGSTAVRLGGMSLCIVPLLWLLWATRRWRPIALGSWRIEAPSPPLAVAQIALAVTDILIVATVLYLLVPAADLGFVVFVGLYTIAVTIGSVSGVPGGLGVIEGMLLVLLPDIASAALLGAVLLWRLIYYLVPLAIALALLGWQLLRERRAASAKGGRREGGR